MDTKPPELIVGAMLSAVILLVIPLLLGIFPEIARYLMDIVLRAGILAIFVVLIVGMLSSLIN